MRRYWETILIRMPIYYLPKIIDITEPHILEDTDYFRRVLVNNEPLYYSDYRQKLEEQQKEQNQTGLASTGPKLVLANAAQTGVVQDVYDDSQQDEKTDSKAAFSTSAFLVVSFSVVCGLMMVLAYVLAM